MNERDGEFECGFCKAKLNATDVNCWRCGSKDLVDKREPMIGAGPFNVPIAGLGTGGDSTLTTSSVWIGPYAQLDPKFYRSK